MKSHLPPTPAPFRATITQNSQHVDLPRSSLFVGIGSPNGDDQVGWAIAERLMQQQDVPWTVRTARHPADLLDWLGGMDRLIVCDGFIGTSNNGELCHWRWPTDDIQRIEFSGSHDLSLPAVLELAERLGQLPPLVSIFGVSICAAEPGGDFSPALQSRVAKLAETISRQCTAEACHA